MTTSVNEKTLEPGNIRALSDAVLDSVSGGAIHIHIPYIFHLAISEHGASIGIDDTDGPFVFGFE